ncbi:MAG: toxin-antitoxin (TA) system antitoxin [Armatimonadota bacterium]|nr:toxin-antitoxin (TA) system antitoxin [Armatimonadota bacterium]
MTRTIDVLESEVSFSELVAMARVGTEVILMEGDRAFARLTPIPAPAKKRIAGLNAGSMQMSDDFDAPLPDSFWTGTK